MAAPHNQGKKKKKAAHPSKKKEKKREIGVPLGVGPMEARALGGKGT